MEEEWRNKVDVVRLSDSNSIENLRGAQEVGQHGAGRTVQSARSRSPSPEVMNGTSATNGTSAEEEVIMIMGALQQQMAKASQALDGFENNSRPSRPVRENSPRDQRKASPRLGGGVNSRQAAYGSQQRDRDTVKRRQGVPGKHTEKRALARVTEQKEIQESQARSRGAAIGRQPAPSNARGNQRPSPRGGAQGQNHTAEHAAAADANHWNQSSSWPHSPREDCIASGGGTATASSVARSTRDTDGGSRGDVDGAQNGGAQAQSKANDTSSELLHALQQELEEERRKNQRLEEELQNRSQQLDEAQSECDREKRRSEGLEMFVHHLQRQLQEATERSLAIEQENKRFSEKQWCEEEPNRQSVPARDTMHRHPEAHVPMAQSTPAPQAVETSPSSVPASAPAPVEVAATKTDSPRKPPEGDNGAETDSHGKELESGISHTLVPADAPPEGGEQLEPTTAEVEEESEEDRTKALEQLWEFVVQGQLDLKEQADFAPKSISCFPSDAMDRICSRGVACVCSRGRRLDSSVPNQDDFLLAMHARAREGHVALYGVFDGHGPAGHHCAAFARSYLPECIFSHQILFSQPEVALRHAFQATQRALCEQAFDTQVSGTTAALGLVLDFSRGITDQGKTPKENGRPQENETWLFVAHAGDSRVILASQKEEVGSFAVTALTRDHKPDDPEEEKRVQSKGGDVRRLHNGSGSARVFAPGQNKPGLALTRTLGDSAASDCGVTYEPEVSAYRLRPGTDVLLVLGTDGLFEFCSNKDVSTKLLQCGVDSTALEELCAESRQRWAANSYNETVDDITAVAVSLSSHFG